MARNSEQDGVATDLARQAADKARMAAGWLADRDPGSLLDEVRSFARKKPGTYLALALGAGVLAGRLTRGLGAPAENSDQPERTSATTGSSQVGSEHHALGGGLPTVDPYGYDPIPDPVLPATPAGSGNGGSGTFGGPRGDRSLGDLISEVTEDLSTLMRQELELAKAELQQSATRAGKGAGMLGGAAVAGYFVLLFASIAIWWAIGAGTGLGWSALIVAVIWGIIAAVLAATGRASLRSVRGLSKTADTVKRIPDALKGNE
jgi:hypothetical protein